MTVRNTKTARLAALSTTAMVAFAAAGLSAPSAMAQEAESDDRVTVTGSRIQRQDFTANSPIVTVDEDTFENTSTIGVETVLNQLPQFVPTLTEFSSTTLQNTADQTPGASVVNLRGLGSFRTLTLIDGRRAQPVNGVLAVDTNSIPSSAVERVEIISGGASAVYGADAVAGVVNFILKDNFEGFDFTTRYGMTEEGDGEQFQASALMGATLANGRGSVMLGAEHASRSPAYERNRDWINRYYDDPNVPGTEGQVVETYVDLGYAGNAGNGADPDVIAAIFGEIPSCNYPGNGDACDAPGPTSQYFVNRTADGTGTLFTGGLTFSSSARGAPAGSFRYAGPMIDPDTGYAYRKIRADGVLDQNRLDALTTVPLKRYSLFGKGEFDITENISAYLRGNFAHTQTDTLTAISPAVNNWSAPIPVGFEGTLWAPSLNADGTTNAAYLPGGVYGLNCPATGGCTESQAFPLPPELEQLLRSRPDPDQDVFVHRGTDYFGQRQTHNRVSTFQITFGLEGELANDWVWDVSATHGVTETATLYDGYTDLAQYRAVVASPNYGVAFDQTGLSATSSGRGRCTTGLPIFRDFIPSDDCAGTIGVDMQATSQLEQSVLEANLAGDLFELPAGPLQFALGASYRSVDYNYVNDNINNSYTFITQPVGVFAQGNTEGFLDTQEIYGELFIPIISNVPGIQQFNLELGGRLSDYNTSGTTDTFKILGDWAVNDWLRLRGGFNKATRAPHIVETYLNQALGFAFLVDPCSQNSRGLDYSANPTNGAAAAQAEQICRELMTPIAEEVYYGIPVNRQPNFVLPTTVESGNPNVEPETAETWTIGAVASSPFDNPWLSGFRTTIDYYRIEIDGVISLENPAEIWKQCIESGSSTSSECSTLLRDPFDGRMTLVPLKYINRGTLLFSGIDLALSWSGDLEELVGAPGRVSINSQWTFPIDRETQDGPDADVIENVGTLNCGGITGISCSGYDYQVFTTFNYSVGDWSASMRWNHYPTIEAADLATNPDSRERGVFESYDVFSLTGSYRINENFTLRAGIDNLFNAEPPLEGGDFAADGDFVNNSNPPDFPVMALPSSNARYDQLGRRFFVGATASF